jgi:hypothetical protein
MQTPEPRQSSGHQFDRPSANGTGLAAQDRLIHGRGIAAPCAQKYPALGPKAAAWNGAPEHSSAFNGGDNSEGALARCSCSLGAHSRAMTLLAKLPYVCAASCMEIDTVR